jgi:hypothetical protein
MESAWATAALLKAKAVNTTRRLSMVGLREQFAAQRAIPRAAFKEMPRYSKSVGRVNKIKMTLCSSIQRLSTTRNGRFLPPEYANICSLQLRNQKPVRFPAVQVPSRL